MDWDDLNWLVELLAADIAEELVRDSEGEEADPSLYSGDVEAVLVALRARGVDLTMIRRMIQPLSS